MVSVKTLLLAAFGWGCVAAGLYAGDPQRFGQRPARNTAVIELEKVLCEHERYRQAEHQRRKNEAAEAARIDQLRNEVRQWQSWAKQLRGGTEDDLAARALRDIIAAKQLDIAAAAALAKINEQYRARENLNQALDEIADEVQRFASKHDIALVVSIEREWEYPFYSPPTRGEWNCIVVPEKEHYPGDPMTPAAAKALFDREVVHHQNLNISYDIIDRLKRPRSP